MRSGTQMQTPKLDSELCSGSWTCLDSIFNSTNHQQVCGEFLCGRAVCPETNGWMEALGMLCVHCGWTRGCLIWMYNLNFWKWEERGQRDQDLVQSVIFLFKCLRAEKAAGPLARAGRETCCVYFLIYSSVTFHICPPRVLSGKQKAGSLLKRSWPLCQKAQGCRTRSCPNYAAGILPQLQADLCSVPKKMIPW